MQGRSWMAALAGVAVAALVLATAPPVHAEDAVVVKKVTLTLRIAGLSRDGCDVEVKPGHPGCRFDKVKQHVDSAGEGTIVLKDVECRSADRDCSFLITVKEPGQADSVVRRGFQLPAPDADGATARASYSCFINAPSKVARAEAERTRR